MIFYNGIIHTMRSEKETYAAMEVNKGIITRLYDSDSDIDPRKMKNAADLKGRHVYPCLIDGHTHMLLTIAVMAMGFNACEITPSGVEPHTLEGVGERIRKYAAEQKQDAVIAINNYILTAIDERVMPSRKQLDEWGGGRAVVVYNIDGHSTSLSSRMLEMVGIKAEGHSGVLQGEDNERTQGRIIELVGKNLGLKELARGIGAFHNACADYGINIVGALEGNGDSEKDPTTGLIIKLARHFDVGVRLYLQYTDETRVRPYRKVMKKLRAGGCGDWEMDGASGSHSAAFSVPYLDTHEKAPCYYEQDFVDNKVETFVREGYQIASHAIGDLAINRIISAYNEHGGEAFHRIEHCEFLDDDAFEELKKGRYAVMMQPGYAWIDLRYLHTYEQFLPQEIRERMKFKSLMDAGICVCGSSDSPVQDMDPYLQMLGMVQFYNENESVSNYEALKAYTVNPARAILESDEYGTLEPGKKADFFTSIEDFMTLSPEQVVGFRPEETFYGGKKARRWKGTVGELIRMMLTPAHKI